MSCYEWEHGEITIPSAEWARVKKALRESWANWQDKVFCQAMSLYEDVMKAKEKAGRTRGFDWIETLRKLAADPRPANICWRAGESRARYDGYDLIRCHWDGKGRPPKPKKNWLKTINGKTMSISDEELYIELNDETRTVVWSVSENNHACERARECQIGRDFFRILDTVKWTRGSGGIIVGNDEYNRDSREYGGGGNYSKDVFGSAGQKISRAFF